MKAHEFALQPEWKDGNRRTGFCSPRQAEDRNGLSS